MKTKITKQYVIALAACFISGLGFSQNPCSTVSEQYGAETGKSTVGWTLVHPPTNCSGTAVSIGNSKFNYNSCTGGEENRMYKPIPTLSNSWIADFDFFVNVTGTNTPAEILAAFTAGTLDAYNTVTIACNNGSFPASDQDAIIASINSDQDNNNSWRFLGGSKDQSGLWSMSAGIFCPQATATYYIRLQRLDQTHGLISVFTNAARTIHLAGSPQCFNITGNVTNLNTLQHGNIPQGGQERKLNGTIDNMCVSNQSPIITGPAQVDCCSPRYCTFTVSGIIGATYTAASWTIPAGSTNISYSPDFKSISFSFPPCGWTTSQQVSCRPWGGTACTYTLTKNVTMLLCKVSSVEDETEQSDNLYPNPNTGTFTFSYKAPEGGKTDFEITDLAGRKIASYKLKEGSNSLEVNQSTLEEGIYFYSIVQDGKIIKTKQFSVIK